MSIGHYWSLEDVMARIYVNGQKIKELRENSGFTKRQFAKKVKCSPSIVTRMEDEGITSEPTLKNVADVLGIHPSEIKMLQVIKESNTDLALRTKQQRMEEGLRHIDYAVEKSTQAIMLADLDKHISYSNRAGIRLWGFSEDELMGKLCCDLWWEKDKAIKAMERALKRGGWLGELTAKHKDDTLFKVITSLTLVADDMGKPICIMGSFIRAFDIEPFGSNINDNEENPGSESQSLNKKAEHHQHG